MKQCVAVGQVRVRNAVVGVDNAYVQVCYLTLECFLQIFYKQVVQLVLLEAKVLVFDQCKVDALSVNGERVGVEIVLIRNPAFWNWNGGVEFAFDDDLVDLH